MERDTAAKPPLDAGARPSAPSAPLSPENTGPNYGASWGESLEAAEAAKLAKVRAEIRAEVSRIKAKQKPAATSAAREMERETFRRLPEQVAARGDPPAQSSVPPLEEQGAACASRGMDYLADFWANLIGRRQARAGRLEARRGLLRTAGGGEDRPLVVFQDFQPCRRRRS